MIDPAITLSIHFGLAVLLFVAAIQKATHFDLFVNTLGNYALTPTSLTRTTAAGLVVAEALLAILLPTQTIASTPFFVCLLLLVYALAMAINLLRGRHRIHCGCSGPLDRTANISWVLVARNLGLAALALVSALPVVERSFSWVDVVVVFSMLLTSTFIYLSFNMFIQYRQTVQRYSLVTEYTPWPSP